MESVGRQYEIIHLGAFDVARKLIEHIAFDHYIFDIDFPDTHAEWLQFIHETIERRIDPSYIASKYYNYGNGLRFLGRSQPGIEDRLRDQGADRPIASRQREQVAQHRALHRYSS